MAHSPLSQVVQRIPPLPANLKIAGLVNEIKSALSKLDGHLPAPEDLIKVPVAIPKTSAHASPLMWAYILHCDSVLKSRGQTGIPLNLFPRSAENVLRKWNSGQRDELSVLQLSKGASWVYFAALINNLPEDLKPRAEGSNFIINVSVEIVSKAHRFIGLAEHVIARYEASPMNKLVNGELDALIADASEIKKRMDLYALFFSDLLQVPENSVSGSHHRGTSDRKIVGETNVNAPNACGDPVEPTKVWAALIKRAMSERLTIFSICPGDREVCEAVLPKLEVLWKNFMSELASLKQADISNRWPRFSIANLTRHWSAALRQSAG